jgi:hypothetical protein
MRSGAGTTGRIARRVGLILALAALVATACSNDDEAPLASATTASTTSTTSRLVTGPDEADVIELWEQTLGIFEAAAEDRETVAAQLNDRIPVESLLEQLQVLPALPEEVDASSNARLTPHPDGTVTIADCTDTNTSTGLGRSTAGFTATAQLDDQGRTILTDIELVRNCIQADIAEAALDQYERFLDLRQEFWADPRIDHPSLALLRTEKAEAAIRAYLADLEERDRLDDTFLQLDSATNHLGIAGYDPGEVRIRNCQHGDETFGLFNAAGERIDQFEAPWQTQIVIKMLLVDGEWLFDELISRTDGPCDPDTVAGLQQL